MQSQFRLTLHITSILAVRSSWGEVTRRRTRCRFLQEKVYFKLKVTLLLWRIIICISHKHLYNLWELLAPGASCYFIISKGNRMIDMMRSQSWNPNVSVVVPDACNFPSIKNSTLAFMAACQKRLLRWLSHMSEAKGSEVTADFLLWDHPEHNWYTVGHGLRQAIFKQRYSTLHSPGNGPFEPEFQN